MLGRLENTALIAIPVLTNAVIVWALDLSPFHWYLTVATGSSFAFALAAVMSNLDEYPELISPNFVAFQDAMSQITLSLTFGYHFGAERPPIRAPFSLMEWGLAEVIALLGDWLLLAWVYALAPLLYPAYLILGAPARVGARTQGVAYRLESGWVWDPKTDDLPEGAKDLSIRRRPVSFTAVLTAAVLWVVSQLA